MAPKTKKICSTIGDTLASTKSEAGDVIHNECTHVVIEESAKCVLILQTLTLRWGAQKPCKFHV